MQQNEFGSVGGTAPVPSELQAKAGIFVIVDKVCAIATTADVIPLTGGLATHSPILINNSSDLGAYITRCRPRHERRAGWQRLVSGPLRTHTQPVTPSVIYGRVRKEFREAELWIFSPKHCVMAEVWWLKFMVVLALGLRSHSAGDLSALWPSGDAGPSKGST